MLAFAQKLILLSGFRRLAVAFLAGALTALSLAPFHIFVVGFVTFPILVWLLDGAIEPIKRGLFRRSAGAFWIGWSFGFGYFTAGLWWIANALLVEAPEFAWAIPLAVFGLPAFLAIFYGIATALARKLWSDGVARILVLAAAFGFVEWVRSFIFTGFPWNALGQAIQPAPLMMQLSALVGSDVMNIFAVTLFALPACFINARRQAALASVLLVLLLVGQAGYGAYRLHVLPDPADEGRVIRLVQPSVDQSEKWAPGRARQIFDDLLALTVSEPVDETLGRPQIIIWPETSVPFILTREPGAMSAISDALSIGQTLIAGVVREEIAGETQANTGKFYNAMVQINDEGIITGSADKVHLVPFGEYLPFSERLQSWGFRAVAAADRGYVPGGQRRGLELPGGLAAIPLICYEIIFSNEITRLSAGDGLIINVTNDAWYGNTPGPYQHLHQSQLRAVETGLPVARGTNNGISAMIDSKGRITNSLAYYERGAIDSVLSGSLPETLGSRYKLHLFALMLLAFATIGFINRANRSP